MASPVFAVKGRNSDPGITNVRNVALPRRWLDDVGAIHPRAMPVILTAPEKLKSG
jgi:hypothetical protein